MDSHQQSAHTSETDLDSTLLSVSDLTVKFPTRFGEFTAIENVDLSINSGEIHGLVGESGAGKSTIGAAVIGLLPGTGYISNGTVTLQGTSLTQLDKEDYHRLRGSRISMIFQDPQTSLNPLLTIADQLIETIRQHSSVSEHEARLRAISLLSETGIHDAADRLDDYPHQFSGGMRQRVVIALALCTDPELIIADEPTTALDVSVQKQILKLISELAEKRNVGFLLITHDIGVIAEITHRVTVLRNGQIVETGATIDVLGNPQHSYTQSLMAAVPRLDKRLERFVNITQENPEQSNVSAWKVAGASAEYAEQWLLKKESEFENYTSTPILSIKNMDVEFGSTNSHWFSASKKFKALSKITMEVKTGSVLGLIGESGSGKSTLAKAITGLITPTAGEMEFCGEVLPFGKKRDRHHPARRRIQMVFQDPYSSLNNRRIVEDIIAEPIRFYGLAEGRTERRKLVASVLELVEMPQQAMLKYPHQFSGGQRQRIAVARALVAKPEFLICDEPTSALDVSIQAQILNLLKDLQQNFGLSLLFISHNLAVVRQMADTVVVLKRGELIETAQSDAFFSAPQEPYSQLLLSETPSLDMINAQRQQI